MLALLVGTAFAGFREDQQQFPRVRDARENTRQSRADLFRDAGLRYPPNEIFIRIFKHERTLELWARDSSAAMFKLLRLYNFTSYSGHLGPKRRQGDRQIPEGVYFVDRFNPKSKYHLSLGINYPNKWDRKRSPYKNPGGDIFIHGSEVTIGCVPIGNDKIEELYVIAVDARDAGQSKIPVHIFPCRLSEAYADELLRKNSNPHKPFAEFWETLRPIYDYFEQTHLVPIIVAGDDGEYVVGE